MVQSAPVKMGRVTTQPLQICVYLGSSFGKDPAYREAAHALGREIAAAGAELVYGGGHVGLMGVVADSVMEHGSAVTGVMTEQLVALETAHHGLTRLEVLPSMHERKARMAELADAVIVLPGGFGTFEETFEILTWNQLGIVSMPVVFLDVNDFFAPLMTFIEGSTVAGFMKEHHGSLSQRTDDPAEAVRLAAQPAPAFTPKWVN